MHNAVYSRLNTTQNRPTLPAHNARHKLRLKHVVTHDPSVCDNISSLGGTPMDASNQYNDAHTAPPVQGRPCRCALGTACAPACVRSHTAKRYTL